jgi:hypothetical protein
LLRPVENFQLPNEEEREKRKKEGTEARIYSEGRAAKAHRINNSSPDYANADNEYFLL